MVITEPVHLSMNLLTRMLAAACFRGALSAGSTAHPEGWYRPGVRARQTYHHRERFNRLWHEGSSHRLTALPLCRLTPGSGEADGQAHALDAVARRTHALDDLFGAGKFHHGVRLPADEKQQQ